jgi:hypothetical protein
MATMFQLDIRQYKKIDNQLDLGYVAAIICELLYSPCTLNHHAHKNVVPISILISALLIWAALKASHVERGLSRIYGRGEPRAIETAITTSFAPTTLGMASVQRRPKDV